MYGMQTPLCEWPTLTTAQLRLFLTLYSTVLEGLFQEVMLEGYLQCQTYKYRAKDQVAVCDLFGAWTSRDPGPYPSCKALTFTTADWMD